MHGDASPSTMRFLPLGLDVRGRRCVVVGGGAVGTRKAHTLERAGASVTVVSPTASSDLMAGVHAGRLTWLEEEFRPDHLTGAFLVVAATDDTALNATVVRVARQSATLACDASSSEGSQVIFGALLADDDTTIAVFTDGQDPRRARAKRDQLDQLLHDTR